MAEPIETRSVSRRTVLKGVAGVAGLRDRPRDHRGVRSVRRERRHQRGGPERRSEWRRPSAAAPSAGATGETTLGSNYSDAVPKAAMQAHRRLVHRPRPASRSRSTPSTTARSRTRSARTSRARRTTSFTWFAGYRMRFFAAQGLATDISDVWANDRSTTTPRLQGRLDGRRRQAVLHPDLQLSVGRLLPEEPVQEKGYTIPTTFDEFTALGDQDEDRRPRPARLRRQGRLAGDGHVRHPQHAPERLRLPRRPDGRHGEVDRPEGQGRLREVEGAPPLPPGGRRRPDLAGRAQATLVQKTAGDVLPGHVRVAAAGRRPG